MKPLKIAQIGIGHDHAINTFETLCRLPEYFEVLGWCAGDGEEDRAEAFEQRFTQYGVKQLTLDELLALPGLEAVTVEADDWNLTKYAHIAAEHGLHIQMDKPGGLDSDEYEAMLRAVKKGGKAFQTGYMYRYNPYYLEILDKLEKGEIGTIYSVEAHMDCLHGAPKRSWLGHFGGGMMNFLGCHLVDLIFRLQGVPDEILALNTSSGFDGVTANDIGFAVFRYPHGVSFAKTAACEPGGFMRRQLVVCGEKQTVTLLPFEHGAKGGITAGQDTGMRVCRKEDCGDWQNDGVHSTSPVYDRYGPMLIGFYELATGARTNPYTLDYEARLHRILLAACGDDINYKKKIDL